jgi:predicted phosphodiesterase
MNVLPFPAPAAATAAGRACPRDYAYAPSVFARSADFAAETLYIVGGLYGNLAALAAVEAMAAAEGSDIVCNGDFHWFDAESSWFAAIEQGVAHYRALRGNVETEIARDEDIGAGCGCAYPDGVDDDVVRRSNDILVQLADIAPKAARARLRGLPMHLVAQVGSLRVGIVHGDASALAGWRFAQDALDAARNQCWLGHVRSASQIDVFACTHTCLAALREFTLSAGRLVIVNNGAAGMPNFAGSTFGVITRIATTPSPHPPLYGLERDGVHIDALAVNYDQDAFIERFTARWPQNSPAHTSYFRRIVTGPDYSLAQAMPR